MSDELVFASPLVAVGLVGIAVGSWIRRARERRASRDAVHLGREGRRALAADTLSYDREKEMAIAHIRESRPNLAAPIEITHEVREPLGVLEDGTASIDWLVHSTTRELPAVERLRLTRVRCAAPAEYGRSYDGWGAAIPRP